MKTNQLIQIVVGGIALLLLAAIGVSASNNANSLAKLEEAFNTANPGIVESGGQAADQGQQVANPDSGASNADSGSGTSDDGGDTGSTSDASGSEDDKSFAVILPGENGAIVLSSLLPEIQIQLKNIDATIASNVSAQVFILKRVLSPTETVALSKGISSDPVTLESIETITANITLVFKKEDLPPTGTYKGWLIVTGEGITPVSKELTFDVISFPAGDAELSSLANMSVRLPSENLLLSRDRHQIVFGLENLDILKNITVNAQLLIAERTGEDNKKTVIPGYVSSTATVELKPGEIKNITLEMNDRLPPSGKYAAWLIVSGENSQLIAKEVTLIVATDPQIGIQSRFTGKAEGDKTITITGIRNWPLSVSGMDWNNYELKLWESNLHTTDCTIIASELEDKTNGRTGALLVEPLSPCSNATDFPVTVKLTPSGINYPGAYAGSLRIITPADSASTDVITVNVLARDRLIWPALVIFLGVVISGIAIRFALGDGKKNVAYLEYLIGQGRIFSERESSSTKTEATLLLDMAELLLEISDLDAAFRKIKEAYLKLGLTSPEAAGREKETADEGKTFEKIKKLARRVRRMSVISTLMWASIATVAGLIYIGRLLPTFGSPMDYILALGWALGLSTVAKPAESVAASILKSLTGQDKPEAQQEPKTPEPPSDKVKVPDVENKIKADAEEEFKKVELEPVFKSKNDAPIEDGWVVIGKTDPPADTEVDKNTKVSCTLGPKESDEETDHETP